MAELNITLRYNYWPARLVFIIMMATLPIWEVAAPLGVGYIIGEVLRGTDSLPFGTVVTVIPALLLLITTAIAITGCSEDNRFYLSKDGMSFPLFFLPIMRFRRAKQWRELLAADLLQRKGLEGRKKSWLCLTFNNGAVLRVDLSCFAIADVEQLLLAVELWASQCKRSDELITYQKQVQDKIQNQGKDSKQIGYTRMWEEELGRRFQATSFVPLEPGQSLLRGRLKIIRQLAFGGLSAIYLAQENQLDMVVLKEAVVPSNAEPEAKAEAERRLVREAELLSRFQHPRVARVLDHFVDAGRHYLKLEYVNGTDLRQYVKQHGPVAQVLAASWGIQILEVLQSMHSQDPPILHRDLTPENLVLTRDTIILIDFGAANEFVGTATGTIVGKQSYMPPEQLRGKSVIESDLYAFGGTMHFLLTGSDPLPLAVAHPKSINANIDEIFDEIVARCSAFEPEDRYHSAGVVLQDLKQLLLHFEKNLSVQLQGAKPEA